MILLQGGEGRLGPAGRLLVLLLVFTSGGCRWFPQRPPADVLARVNGQPVTDAELQRQVDLQTVGGAHPLSPDQTVKLRLTLLDQLIDRHLLLQYAVRQGVIADPREVSREFDLARVREPERPAAELRQQVTDDLILDELLAREVTAKVEVSDRDIAEFYEQNQAGFRINEKQYHVMEIVVTPVAGQVTNLAEDKAQTLAAARKKIAMLQQRLAQKADFATLAQQYSEDPNTAASGGDLGLLSQSALDNQTPEALRNAIQALRPGQVSPVVVTPAGFYLIKLVGVENPGTRTVNDPEVRKSIHDLLGNTRRQVLQAAFLSVVRDKAKVENYYAEQVLRNGGG